MNETEHILEMVGTACLDCYCCRVRWRFVRIEARDSAWFLLIVVRNYEDCLTHAFPVDSRSSASTGFNFLPASFHHHSSYLPDAQHISSWRPALL